MSLYADVRKGERSLTAETLEKAVEAIDADNCTPAADKPVYSFFKRAVDIVLSLAASAVLLIPCLIISLAIFAEDRGPVIYAHSRVGKNGRVIKVYKFRSMRSDADNISKYLTPEQQQEFYKEYKLKNDPRVTRVGRILRKTSLDELPQIFLNVLILGNMSVVGPRPVVMDETMLYGGSRDALLSVKPGLTGFWAAYSDKDTSYEDGSRQRMELYYIKNRSALLDLKIIFKTVGTVFERCFMKEAD